jgi:hypothetical protein
MKINFFYYVAVVCFVYLAGCQIKTQKGIETNSINEEKMVSNKREPDISSIRDSLTSLPFNSGEWLDWRNSVDTGAIDDDGRYTFYYIEDNPHIKDICKSILKNDTTIYGYFLLDTKRDFKTYLLRLITNEVGIHFELVNMHNEQIISHLYLGAFTPTTFIAFNISSDLKIDQYKYDLSDNRKRKIMLGHYQIKDDGSITNLE